ncbi:MAG TPA: response regulator transcription factor [Devosiaceae bacterium]|jgi:DNA-binding NarL/FixJ family response regulator
MMETPLTSVSGAGGTRPARGTNIRVVGASHTPANHVHEHIVVVIDHRELDRECLVQSLTAQSPAYKFLSYPSVGHWQEASAQHLQPSAILLTLADRRLTEQRSTDLLTELVAAAGTVPVIVVADTDELPQIIAALQHGARGYIPTNVGLRVASEAIAMTIAGGLFVPASSVLAVSEQLLERQAPQRQGHTLFTDRQMAVVEALRRGRANKIIAYELNLRESTVKVHIRNIMRKLNATNRTEVAFKIRNMFPE